MLPINDEILWIYFLICSLTIIAVSHFSYSLQIKIKDTTNLIDILTHVLNVILVLFLSITLCILYWNIFDESLYYLWYADSVGSAPIIPIFALSFGMSLTSPVVLRFFIKNDVKSLFSKKKIISKTNALAVLVVLCIFFAGYGVLAQKGIYVILESVGINFSFFIFLYIYLVPLLFFLNPIKAYSVMLALLLVFQLFPYSIMFPNIFISIDQYIEFCSTNEYSYTWYGCNK